MVDLYRDCYNKIKRRRINDAVFAPFGLNQDSFIAQQKEMSEIFIKDIFDKVDKFPPLSATQTIIAGIDKSTGVVGPRIFCIKRGYADYDTEICCDSVGYAVIGVGERHADTFLMQSNFTRHFPPAKTLFLCYAAKRRSEVAPGVGKQTDIRIMSPVGRLFYVENPANENKELVAIYDKMVVSEKISTSEAISDATKHYKGKLPTPPFSDDQETGEPATKL
jgi:hypothetical protein